MLVGTSSNRSGLGATVHMHSGGQICSKYNDGKSGYLAQSVLPLSFGLRDADRIDRVEVDWPSRRKQALTKEIEEIKLSVSRSPGSLIDVSLFAGVFVPAAHPSSDTILQHEQSLCNDL